MCKPLNERREDEACLT